MTSLNRRNPGPEQSNRLLHGDCLSLLPTLASDSVDLICTDPPYGIGFMGKAWDTFKPQDAQRSTAGNPSFQEWWRQVSCECLRVLKPGAFMFVAMTPRQDSLCRAMIAMEEAGFAMAFSSLYWTYASGFPKALNIGKAVDRRLGAERPILGTRKQHDIRNNAYGSSQREFVEFVRGGPVTREAKRLDGGYAGFQPKPAVEAVIVAMKPLSEGSYVDQALHNGKGVMWLGDCRIPADAPISIHDAPGGTFAGGQLNRGSKKNYRESSAGRFPANLLVSDGTLGRHSAFFSLDAWSENTLPFLVVPKASKREKNAGTGHVSHPTVKPLKLMAYLLVLGSRPGDVVLDPFLGSGTTAVAAKLLGRRLIGIEREGQYLKLARARLRRVPSYLLGNPSSCH